MTLPIAHYAATAADLREIDCTKAFPGWICALAGYWTAFDGAGGVCMWSPTATPDNGGTVFAAKGAGCWQRLELSADGRLNAKQFGCKGDGVSDDTAAARAMLKVIAARIITNPDGEYIGGGRAYFPAGVYAFTGSLQVPPHTIVEGDGRVTTSFVFNVTDGLAGNDGFYLDDHGENSNTNLVFRDFSIYNTIQANSTGGAIDLICGGSNHIERVDCSGWAYGIVVDGSDDTTIDKCSLNASAAGMLGAISVGVWLASGPIHNRGNTTTGSTNNVQITSCQFNGPHVNVQHDDGVGHLVADCNSEGGTLGLFRSANNVVHRGWTEEGADVFSSTPLFHFATVPGSVGEQYVADNVVIHDCFAAGSATQPTVLFDPYAAVGFLQWHRNRVSQSPAAGLMQGCQGLEQLVATGPYPTGGKFLDFIPPGAVILDHATLPLQCSVASLPLGPDPNGQLGTFSGFPRFALDGCKQGEASGSGTGVSVYYSNGAWRRYSDDAPVTA